MTENHLLKLHDVACAYGEKAVVQGIGFTLRAGEIGCLLGPSGCGKTTVLRAIAGFEAVQSGTISLGGQLLSRAGFTLAAEKRRIGMVFQDYALFPHLSVAANIGFGIRKQPDRAQTVAELLELVGLSQEAKRHPQELSGGQQQRVALARALAPKPQLLLLDEPFSNLDAELRRRLACEVRDILKARATAALLVTHDQEEAFAVSDQIGLIYRGHLEQWGSAQKLWQQPKTPFAARFIGQGYFLPATAEGGRRAHSELGAVRTQQDFAAGTPLSLLLRADSLSLAPDSALKAELLGKTFQGAATLCRLRLPSGNEVQALLPGAVELPAGSRIGLQAAGGELLAFEASATAET